MSKANKYGRIRLRIEEILKEKNISKNQFCRDLHLSRTNLNRYCRNDFQRIDAEFFCKCFFYLEVDPSDLVVYELPSETE